MGQKSENQNKITCGEPLVEGQGMGIYVWTSEAHSFDPGNLGYPESRSCFLQLCTYLAFFAVTKVCGFRPEAQPYEIFHLRWFT